MEQARHISGSETFYIAGDICPTIENEDLFSNGDAVGLFGEELVNLLINSKGLVFNLEVALSDNPSPIVKSGPCLFAREDSLAALIRINPLCACLANNHIMDAGKDGFERTMSALNAAGIPSCGAGSRFSSESKYYSFEMAGKTYAIYACAEHEFTIWGADYPGANPFDPLYTYADITCLSDSFDRVIVLYHGMKEHYQYPSPEIRDRCRKMIDAGAMFVSCQHSHCIGCAEKWNGGSILYGQGNFCFAKKDSDYSWNTGLLVSVSSSNQIDYLPVKANSTGVVLLEGSEADSVLKDFYHRSDEILADGFIEAKWESFCEGIVGNYTWQLLEALELRPISVLIRALKKLRILNPEIATGRRSAGLLNMLQCEAHNEVLRTYLRGHLHD